MKLVQIGNAGHSAYTYAGIRNHNINFSAISPGNAGIEAEGIEKTFKNLKAADFPLKLYTNWCEMLETEKPDIAVVDPWYNDHGQIIKFALEHGINVFCDKPIATDFKTLEEIEKCDKEILGAMFDARTNPAFKAAKKAIDEGRIGKVRMMDSRKSYKLGIRPKFYSSRSSYCGIIPWVGIHAIDWMKWLSGEKYTELVGASISRLDNGNNGDMDITSAAQFIMTNDVISTVTADMYRPAGAATHGDDRVRIVGTKGIVEVTDGKVTLIAENEPAVVLQNEPAGDIFDDFLDVLSGKSNHLTKSSCIESTYWALKADEAARKRFEK